MSSKYETMRFRQGEEVLLRSKDDPSLNCDCVVEQVFLWRGQITYKVGVIGPNGFDLWAESALKKKHKPSDMSFKELMNMKEVSCG